MLYQAYEVLRSMAAPYRACALWGKDVFRHNMNPVKESMAMSSLAALCDLFEATTRRYDKPAWNLKNTEIADGEFARVVVKNKRTKPFCDLLHFKRNHSLLKKRKDPKVLILAPMAGHHATLLRGTVEALIPDHDVYITDWRDARIVPLMQGRFGIEEYIEYVMEFIRFLGENVHIIAVCQPGPLALAAVSLMSEDNDPFVPATMTFMGSPIDPRKSPTVPNELATTKSIDWFEKNVIHTVPFSYPGAMRRVYPGFLQLTGFMSMNMDRHYRAHMNLFQNLVSGDGDSVEKHRKFYDEYLSVMDLNADFYLETIKTVFQEAALPRGKFMWKGRKVDPGAITRTALMTVEGKKDDISGVGQTRAAHKICKNIPLSRKVTYLHPTVGHYGVFNGSKWRNEIKPAMAEFFRKFPVALSKAKAKSLIMHLSDNAKVKLSSSPSLQHKKETDIMTKQQKSSKKSASKSEAKKTAVKKKTVAKKVATKSVTKKVEAKKPAAKKATSAKKATTAKKASPKPAAKRTASKSVAKKASPKPVAKKTASKSVAKKAAPKRTASKPVAKKASPKPAAKRTASKPVAKKAAPKPAAKRTASKSVAKKAAPKPAAKRTASKPVAKKAAPKPAAKRTASKPVAKKAAPKPVAKKAAPKPAAKRTASKPVAKKAAPKPAAKRTASKPVTKKAAPKSAAKRTASKPVARKASPKPVAKKASPKPVAKKASPKPAAKRTASKPVAKKASPKPAAKRTGSKPVAKKAAPKPAAKRTGSKPVAKKADSRKIVTKSQDRIQQAAAEATRKVIAEAATSASRSALKVTPNTTSRRSNYRR